MIWLYFGSAVLILSVLALLSLYHRFKREMKEARKKLQAGSQVIVTRLGPVEYAEVGTGYPVLISHGGAGGYDQGLVTAKTYFGEGVRCIAASRFGHLRTPLAEDSSAMAQADAYAALLDALNIERAAILGTSGGGPSALQFALRHSDRCAALILTAAVSQYHPPRPLGIYKSDFLYWLVTTYLKSLTLTKIGVTPELQAKLRPAEKELLSSLFVTMNPISMRKEGLFHDVAEWSDQMSWDTHYPLEQITAPTLVIHALDDQVVPFSHAQHAATSIPGAQLIELQQGGHLRLGCLEAIRSGLHSFLSKASLVR